MATQGVNGLAVMAAAGGALLAWSGITGAALTKSLRSLLSGQQPSSTDVNPIQTQAASNVATSGGTVPAGPTGVGPGSAIPSGGQFDHSQLMALWQKNGGSAAAANNAACHAIQESGGNPQVTSPNPDGGTNVGLWQLDTPGGKGHGFTIAQLQNPDTNARVAVMGSRNGTDWSAWATPGC